MLDITSVGNTIVGNSIKVGDGSGATVLVADGTGIFVATNVFVSIAVGVGTNVTAEHATRAPTLKNIIMNKKILCENFDAILFCLHLNCAPNGVRYPLVGGMRQRDFDGTHFKPCKVPENAPTPTSRVHAGLGAVFSKHFIWPILPYELNQVARFLK